MKLLKCLHTLDNNLVQFIVKTQTKTKLVADPFQEMMEETVYTRKTCGTLLTIPCLGTMQEPLSQNS